jgi:hypothetical protein
MGPGRPPGEVSSRRPVCRSHIGCPRWSCGSHLACAGRASLSGLERLKRGLRSSKQRALHARTAGQTADRVVVGMDPRKRSVTIEVMAGDETVLGGGRFATTVEGYRAMRAYVAGWHDRVWAIEGCAGIGGHVATRLLGDGEQVVDVPPKLSARARVFATGQGRKSDATDAHSVAPWSAPAYPGCGRSSTTPSWRGSVASDVTGRASGLEVVLVRWPVRAR